MTVYYRENGCAFQTQKDVEGKQGLLKKQMKPELGAQNRASGSVLYRHGSLLCTASSSEMGEMSQTW